jgi:hypothetical protein
MNFWNKCIFNHGRMILPVQQSIMLITLGSLTCGEGGNLSTRDLGFIYVSSAGRIGCVFIHPTQPTDAPSSRRSSRSHFYTPGFPRGFQRFKYWITENESIRNTGSRPIKFIAGVLGLGLWCLTPQASTLTFVRYQWKLTSELLRLEGASVCCVGCINTQPTRPADET